MSPDVSKETSPARKGGAFKREFQRIVQQDPPRSQIPLWFFRRPAQMAVSGFCATLFAIIAAIFLSAAASMQETVVAYTFEDTTKSFTIDAIEGPALLSYEIPEFYANQKRYVESKDNFVVGSLLSKYNCDDAETPANVRWRRCPEGGGCSSDPLVATIGGNTQFRPCGLVALSTFMDRYALTHEDGTVISLDESEVSLPSDDAIYKKKIKPIENPSANGPFYTVEGEPSWLTPADYEHFKVWYRTPASPRVRNLWAKIPDGLPAGTYNLNITQNSAVWTQQWQVPEKRVIIHKGSTLGSPGGASFLGVLCAVCAVMQIIMVVVLALAPKRKDA